MNLLPKAVPVIVTLCAAIAGATMQATAQESKRPVRLLVPSPPGGPSDFAGRLAAPRLSDALGRNFVVDNRQSVNGIVATELAAERPRTEEQVPRALARGCDPGAGCRAEMDPRS